jgi:hypothetical protein
MAKRAEIVQQTENQERKQPRIYGRPWPKGYAPNPTGKTRAQRYFEAFVATFQERHGRKPNAVEAVTLHNAAALAVKADGRGSRRVGVEHIVRCGRLLAQLLDQMGLAPAKPEPSPKTPLQTLDEHLALTHGNGGGK